MEPEDPPPTALHWLSLIAQGLAGLSLSLLLAWPTRLSADSVLFEPGVSMEGTEASLGGGGRLAWWEFGAVC